MGCFVCWRGGDWGAEIICRRESVKEEQKEAEKH